MQQAGPHSWVALWLTPPPLRPPSVSSRSLRPFPRARALPPPPRRISHMSPSLTTRAGVGSSCERLGNKTLFLAPSNPPATAGVIFMSSPPPPALQFSRVIRVVNSRAWSAIQVRAMLDIVIKRRPPKGRHATGRDGPHVEWPHGALRASCRARCEDLRCNRSRLCDVQNRLARTDTRCTSHSQKSTSFSVTAPKPVRRGSEGGWG